MMLRNAVQILKFVKNWVKIYQQVELHQPSWGSYQEIHQVPNFQTTLSQKTKLQGI
jgi:hypothetical protein